MKKKCKHFWPLMLIVLMIFACGDGDDGAFSISDDSASPSSDNGTDVTDSVDDTDGGDGYRYLWSTLISTETVIFRDNPLFGFQLFSSPAVATDGTIYVGSTDTRLYALDPNGNIKWIYETGDQLVASPAIGSDGTVYIGSADRQLYAINPDGTLKWGLSDKSGFKFIPCLSSRRDHLYSGHLS